MKTIQIDDRSYDRLVVAERLTEQTVGEVVAKLLDRLTVEPAVDSQATTHRKVPMRVRAAQPLPDDPEVKVFKVFKGNRVDGVFNVRTHELRVTTPPWSNKAFSSPTAAAVAVVDHFAGEARETNNTNGRKFWKLSATGESLLSLIGAR
jgi:hypothetical protein